jgi:hypothetical protein
LLQPRTLLTSAEQLVSNLAALGRSAERTTR